MVAHPGIESRRELARKTPVRWEGDLSDDCSASWVGLLLRAEWMDGEDGWWCFYDEWGADPENQVSSSNHVEESFTSGESAREAAEAAAKKYLGL